MATYKNIWHTPGKPYGPEYYKTNNKPIKYKGYLIYERISKEVFDIVLNSICLSSCAGINGAKRHIDKLVETIGNTALWDNNIQGI